MLQPWVIGKFDEDNGLVEKFKIEYLKYYEEYSQSYATDYNHLYK